VVPEHTSPVAQVPPGQHGWVSLPHVWQVPLTHAWVLSVQAPPRQQGCPAPPHCVHLPDAHAKPVSQRSSAQQSCPAPPQAVHVLSPVHTLPTSQRLPVAVHTFAESMVVSQQPVLHVSPAQHG
jgi:hypothetical protein